MAFPFVVNGLANGCSENRKNDALLAGSFGNAAGAPEQAFFI